MFMLVNVYLSDLMGQNTLHGSLNRRAADTSARRGTLNIMVIRYRIIASDDD